MAKHRGEPPVWTRKGMAIVPMNDAAFEMLRGFQSGELFTGSFHRKRSLRQLRLWWGLMTILVESGYSLFDIRDHWEELKAARFRYYGASATSETAGQTQHLALKGSAK